MLRFGTQITLDHLWGEVDSVPEYAKKLEEWGYDLIWCPDERFERSPYVILTLAAQATTQVKLGVSVTNPYTRHPLITGSAVATVNEVSGGRAVFGLGAGASSFFERQGIERPSPPVVSIREVVEILRPFIRGKTVNYKGKTHNFTGANIDFQSHPAPIYIAARGPKLLQLAGEVADGVIIGSLTSPEGLKYALKNVRLGLEKSNRNSDEFDIVLWAYTAITDNMEVAKNRVSRLVVSSMWSSRKIIDKLGLDEGEWRPLEEEMKAGFRKGLSSREVYASAARKLSNVLIESWSLAGDVEFVKKRVDDAKKAGIKHIAILALGESRSNRMETQRVFAESIMRQV
jgi:5,10-methylenetetrahydromethanopterin reductase